MKKKEDLFDIIWKNDITRIILIILTYEMYRLMFVKFLIKLFE